MGGFFMFSCNTSGNCQSVTLDFTIIKSKIMKTKVLDFLKKPSDNPVDDFNTGFALLQRTEGISQGTLRNYNNQGYTPQSLENIKYDLQKAHEISDLDILNHETEAPVLDIAPAAQAYDQKLFIEANKDQFTNILKDMNDSEKAGLSISVQYTFLREEDCPSELKVLVNDVITSYHNFRAAHTELYEKVVQPENSVLTEDEIYEIASGLLSNFELNREIHAELEYYAKKKDILGEHEIFADLKKTRALDALTADEISKRINNLKTYISKMPAKIEAAKTPEAKQKLQEKLDIWEAEKKDLDVRLKAKE